MDYEKKYNEALKDMRAIYPNLKGDAKLAAEHAFPELRESEDERIRKALIDEIKVWDEDYKLFKHVSKEKALAYLEKQKEQDKCQEYCVRSHCIGCPIYEKQKEQKSAEIDEDIKLGLDRALQIIKEAKGVLKGYQSDDGIYECDHAIRTLTHILKNGIEQKPAEWSEEDDKIRRNLMSLLVNMRGDRITEETYQKYYPWLKDLHPSWKPSEEQILAIVEALKYLPNNKDEWMILDTLVDVLKKLM